MKRFLVLSILVAACGGDSGNNPSTDANVSPHDAAPKPLACNSAALCTTYDVDTFLGTVPAPAGGAIHDGLYRLAYKLIPDNVGETGGYHDDLEALEISGSAFRHAGFFDDVLGTIEISGTSLKLHATKYCDLGNDGDAATFTLDYTYTATATALDLFATVMRSDGVSWQQLEHYVLTSSPMEVCETVPTTPSAPGDSAQCHVTNCACSFAVNGTVQTCT